MYVETESYATPTLSPTGLADDPAAEMACAERADAGGFDPEGLYAIEQQRDEVLSDLVASLPADAVIMVTVCRTAGRTAGGWTSTTLCTVSLCASGNGVNQTGATPAEAADKAMNEWRKNQVTVRERPEHREVVDPRTEALGRIDPAEREAFAEWCAGRFVPDAFRVDDEGRVFARTGYVCDEEAESVGKAVEEFKAERAAVVVEGQAA